MVANCIKLVLRCVETEDVCEFLQEDEQGSSTDKFFIPEERYVVGVCYKNKQVFLCFVPFIMCM